MEDALSQTKGEMTGAKEKRRRQKIDQAENQRKYTT